MAKIPDDVCSQCGQKILPRDATTFSFEKGKLGSKSHTECANRKEEKCYECGEKTAIPYARLKDKVFCRRLCYTLAMSKWQVKQTRTIPPFLDVR